MFKCQRPDKMWKVSVLSHKDHHFWELSDTEVLLQRYKSGIENNGQEDGIPTGAFIIQVCVCIVFFRLKHGNEL